MTLDQNVENDLREARRRAEKGDAGYYTFLRSAQTYAKKAGINISIEVAGIRALVQ